MKELKKEIKSEYISWKKTIKTYDFFLKTILKQDKCLHKFVTMPYYCSSIDGDERGEMEKCKKCGIYRWELEDGINEKNKKEYVKLIARYTELVRQYNLL